MCGRENGHSELKYIPIQILAPILSQQTTPENSRYQQVENHFFLFIYEKGDIYIKRTVTDFKIMRDVGDNSVQSAAVSSTLTL